MAPEPTDARTSPARQLLNPFLLGGGLLLAVVLGGIGLIVSPAGAVLGVAIAAALVVWTARALSLGAERAVALRRWGAARGLAYAERAVLPGTTRLLRSGSRRLGVGVSGELAGAHGGVCFCDFTVAVGDTTRSFETTIAWTTVPPLPGVARVHLSSALTGRGLATLLGPERTVELESVELGRRFTIEVDDGADDAVVRRLFEPALITWLLELPDGGELWVQGEGRLLTAVRMESRADERFLADLVARLERVADAWRRAAG